MHTKRWKLTNSFDVVIKSNTLSNPETQTHF